MLRPGTNPADFTARARGSLAELFGLRVTSVDEGVLVMEMDIERKMLAPNGFLHAASVIALADTACGFGCIAHMPEGAENFTTIELKSNFLGTARDGTLACTARAAHLGKTTQVWDAVVRRKSDDREIALFRCTQMVLGPRKAS